MASTQPEALPRGAKLVKIGGSVFRVVWDMGGGLGHAWYTISSDHLKKLYGGSSPAVDAAFGNKDQFEAKYGNNYFGNVAEVNLKNDNPWQDLKERIFNQFGWVPGFDSPEVKRLLVQSYFEDWDQNQWLVEYRKTDYYQKSTDAQRQWVGLSDAEKVQRISEQALQLTEIYNSIWGSNISVTSKGLRDAAIKIASGQMLTEQWEYEQRNLARGKEGTPEWRRQREEQEAARAEGNQEENFGLAAQRSWEEWVGPFDIPNGFSENWGKWLASGERSEADLETYLQGISDARWGFKPEGAKYEDWSSTYKSQIRSTLELGSLDDKDPLLMKVLSTDLSGQDLNAMIRADKRFRSTQTMFGELSSAVEDMGRKFGFIS